MLNVHLVPHTHDDAGWLKTVEQYHFGSNQNHQVAGVQFVLDSVVAALAADPARTFIYGEVAFFSRWWDEQVEDVRATVRDLVASGRLQFVNGGWVQHDEAAAHWEDMVAQTGRGHAWLAATFGPAALPTVQWSIDPFGHSATQASLLTGAAGYDAIFFGRADYQDMAARTPARRLEHVWRGEASYGPAADVFTSNFKSGNYGPLPGFNFDWGQPDDPVIDNACAFDGWNVEAKVEAFVAGVRDLAAATAGCEEDEGEAAGDACDVIALQGSDFQYAAAAITFKSLDKLVHYVNADGRVNVFYSTPAAYVAARHAADLAWPLKTDDFFPYADCPTCMWTGFYASRPALKRNIRQAGGELAAVRQLAARAVVEAGGTDDASGTWAAALDTFEEAVSLGQHHDAVTGTSQQHVANDYAARLEAGREGLRGLVGEALLKEAGGGSGDAPATAPIEWCPALNASVCPASAAASAAGRPFAVLAYNSLARPRRQGILIPVHAGGTAAASSWKVTGPGGAAVPSQLQPVSPGAARAAASLVAAGGASAESAPAHELAFVVEVGPLATAAFVVSPADGREAGAAVRAGVVGQWGGGGGGAADPATTATAPVLLRPTGDAATTRPPPATLHLHPSTGELNALGLTHSGALREMNLAISAAWYNASDGGPSAHAAPGTPDGEWGSPSGAYIFRPHSRHTLGCGGDGGLGRPLVTALAGPVLAEARQDFGPWAATTIRTWAGLAFEEGGLEVEWTAGPLPADGTGREVVISYATDLDTRGALTTDANGRTALTRFRDARPTWDLNVTAPVSGNFYPVTAAAVLEEVDGRGGGGGAGAGDSAGRAFAVLPDRAQGAASLVDGGLELMIHRRLARDDARGVTEPLNETACGCVTGCACGGLVVSGTHTMVAALAGGPITAAWRGAALPVSRPLLVAFVGDKAAVGRLVAEQAAAAAPAPAAALPANVHLLTLAPAAGGRLLVRVAHQFAAGEHADLSAPVRVDLHDLLPAGVRAGSVVEMGLTGARPLADAPAKLEWRVGRPMSEGARKTPKVPPPAPPLECAAGCEDGPLEVELGPLGVRTFLVTPVKEEKAGGGGGDRVGTA